MITVKASQKLFTHVEVANLTGICIEHLRSAAKRFRLGFIAQSFEKAGTQAEQWFVHALGLKRPRDNVPAL